MSLIIIGHRGAMAHKPENSLESYALAEEIGVDQIELDVRLSADRELFLLHDATLDRTAGDDSARNLGPAADLTLAQLQSVILDSGRGVVSLTEMYDATTTVIQLEIKDPAVVPYLERFFAERPDDAARTMITGFSADAVRAAAEAMPQIRRMIIVSAIEHAEAFEGGLDGLLEHSRANGFACGFAGLTRELVEDLQSRGVEVHAWPMTSVDDMRKAIELGIDGTTANDPALAFGWREQVLAENGVAAR